MKRWVYYTQLNELVGLLCTAERAGGFLLEGFSAGEKFQVVEMVDVFCALCLHLDSDQGWLHNYLEPDLGKTLPFP